MADVGQIRYLATLDTSAYERGTKEVESANDRIGESAEHADKRGSKAMDLLGKAGSATGKTIAAGMAVAGAGVTALVANSIKSFSEFEQLSGGAQKIFNEIDYDKIAADAGSAYATMGLSASQYLGVMTTVGATFAATLGDQKGYDVAKQGMQAISDFATGTGKDVDELSQKYQLITRSTSAYQSIADQFSGVLPATSKGFLEAAQEAGYLGKQYTELTQVPVAEYQQAVTDMLTKGVDAIGLAGNTAAEAKDTISGSFGAMAASWQNLITGMSDPNADFGKLLSEFIDTAKAFGKNIIPVIETALTGVVELIGALVPELIKELPSLLSKLIPAVIEAFMGIISALVASLPTLIPVLITGAMQLFMAIVKALPVILPELVKGVYKIITSLATELTKPETIATILDAGFKMYIALVEVIPQIIKALADALPTIIENLIDFFTDPNNIKMLVGASIELFMALVKAVPQILGALYVAFGNLIGMLWGKLQSLFTGFAGDFGVTIGQVFKNAINGVLGFIEGFINTPINLINNAIETINKIPGVNIGKMGRLSIPRLAEGGIVKATPGGILANIGEGGQDEAVIPLDKLDKIVQSSQNTAPPATPSVEINVSGVIVSSPQDQRKFAEVIGKRLNEIMQQKGYEPSLRGV